MNKLALIVLCWLCFFSAKAQAPTVGEVIQNYKSLGYTGSMEFTNDKGDLVEYNVLTYFVVVDKQLNSFFFVPNSGLFDPIEASVFEIPNVKINDWLEYLDGKYTPSEYLQWKGKGVDVKIVIDSEYFYVTMTYHN